MDKEDLEKFHIEKTHASVFELGRHCEKITTMFLLFSITGILITFVVSSDQDSILVPFIGLKLPRWITAECVILFACGALLILTILKYYTLFLYGQLQDIYEEKKFVKSIWPILYPTVLEFTALLYTVDAIRGLYKVLYMVFIASSTYIFLAYMIFYIGVKTSWPISWIIFMTMSMATLVVSYIISMHSMNGKKNIRISAMLEKF